MLRVGGHAMFEQLYMKKLKWNGVAQSISWGFMAIIYILLYPVNPEITSGISGCLLIIQGVAQLYIFIQEDERFIYSIMSLVDAIMISFLGVWVLMKPGVVNDLVSLVFSFVILLHGIGNIMIVVRLKGLNYGHWMYTAGIAIFKIIIASALMILLHFNILAVYMLTGVCMMADGISDAWLWTVLDKKVIEHLGILAS